MSIDAATSLPCPYMGCGVFLFLPGYGFPSFNTDPWAALSGGRLTTGKVSHSPISAMAGAGVFFFPLAMAKTHFGTEGAKLLHRVFEKLTPKRNHAAVFSDFLTVSRCALAGGTMEDEYFEVFHRYEKSEFEVLIEAFACLVIAMEEERTDILGDYFTGAITRGEHGQFYTPENICELMARITEPKAGECVLDPCCGSGRMLLAAGKFNPRSLLCGQDIDLRCVQMCTINLALWGLSGFVTWGDSLKNERRRIFRTGRPGTLGRGSIIELDAETHDFSSREKAEASIAHLKTGDQQGFF